MGDKGKVASDRTAEQFLARDETSRGPSSAPTKKSLGRQSVNRKELQRGNIPARQRNCSNETSVAC